MAQAPSYQFARHNPSGDLYVLRSEEGRVTGEGGPLYAGLGDTVAQDDPASYLDALDEDDNEWAAAQEWTYQ